MQAMQRFLGAYPQAEQAVINKCPQVVVMCKTCQYMLWIKGKTVEKNPQTRKVEMTYLAQLNLWIILAKKYFFTRHVLSPALTN
jgi:hypothetical protein